MCAQSQIYSRLHHFLLSVHGSRWHEVYLAMFTAYIDDSGTDPKQQVANATVLIFPAARIIALEKEWNRLCEKEQFSYWHTSEASARNPKSEFAAWNKDKYDRVYSRIRDITGKYSVQAMSYTVYKKDYDEVAIPHLPYLDKHHYTWAIRSLLAHTENWRKFKQIPQPLEYVFSWMGDKRKNERRQEIEDLLDQAEEQAKAEGKPGEFEHWSFRRAEEVPSLQCVDGLAWCVYQYGLSAFCRKPLPDDAIRAWEHYTKLGNGQWGFDVTVTRKQLQEWVNKELADGRSAKRFEEWRAKKGKLSGRAI